MKCPQCGTQMVASNTSWLCPHCGHSMPKTGDVATPVTPVPPVTTQAAAAPAPVSAPLPAQPSPIAEVRQGISLGLSGTRLGLGMGPASNSRLTRWVTVLVLVPMTLIFMLIAIVGYGTIKADQNLLKTGTVGKGEVTGVHLQVTQNNNNGSTSTSTNTDVSYKLIGVPGYTDQVYSSNLGGDRTGDIQVGEDLPVVYNPKNPSNNGLQEALQNSGSPVMMLVPLMFLVGPLIIITVLVVQSRRAKRRQQAIQELQS